MSTVTEYVIAKKKHNKYYYIEKVRGSYHHIEANLKLTDVRIRAKRYRDIERALRFINGFNLKEFFIQRTRINQGE